MFYGRNKYLSAFSSGMVLNADTGAGTGGAASASGGESAGGESAAANGDTQTSNSTPPVWYASHPDESVRTTMQAKAFNDPNVLATAYMHAHRALSGAKDVVPIPGDDATEEQRNTFYTTLGRPETAAGYEFAPEEGQQNSPEMDAWARDTFFKAGVSAQTAKQLFTAWNKQAASMQQAEQQRISADYNQAIQALGKDAETVLAQGRQAFQSLGLDATDVASLEKAAGSGALVRLFSKIGAGMQGETGKFVGGQGSGAEASVEHMSAEQAASKIKELQGSEDFMKMYRESSNAGHAEAKLKLEQLYRKAYPG